MSRLLSMMLMYGKDEILCSTLHGLNNIGKDKMEKLEIASYYNNIILYFSMLAHDLYLVYFMPLQLISSCRRFGYTRVLAHPLHFLPRLNIVTLPKYVVVKRSLIFP